MPDGVETPAPVKKVTDDAAVTAAIACSIDTFIVLTSFMAFLLF
jgi:hypothetical protein